MTAAHDSGPEILPSERRHDDASHGQSKPSRAWLASRAQSDGCRWAVLPKQPPARPVGGESIGVRRTLRLLARALRRVREPEGPAAHRSRRRG